MRAPLHGHDLPHDLSQKPQRSLPAACVKNGHCEVKPEMRCIWTEAYEAVALQMPTYGHEMAMGSATGEPPVGEHLGWVNMLTGVDKQVPAGWIPMEEVK